MSAREWKPGETELFMDSNPSARDHADVKARAALVAAHAVRAETPEDVREAVSRVVNESRMRYRMSTEIADALLAEFTITRKATP